MKSTFISFLISFWVLINLSGQNQWEFVNEGFGLDISNMDFANAFTGWVAGRDGIHKTDDGGENWNSLPSNVSNFDKIDFINSWVGWAIGAWDSTGTYFLSTLDGGITWSRQREANTAVNFYLVSDRVVFIVENSIDGQHLLKTVDGGSSWEDITPPGRNEFGNGSFLNADIGVVVSEGNILCRTMDGGKTWDFRIASEYTYLYNVSFLDNATGYFLARNEDWEYSLCKTTDAFFSWSVVYESEYDIPSHFFNDSVLISSIRDSSGRNIMKSHDGGQTWEYTNSINLPGYLRYGFYFSDNTGYLVGQSGQGSILLLKTIDHGMNWSMLNLTSPFKDVCFIDENTGYLVAWRSIMHGSYGSLIKISEGGEAINFIHSHGVGGNWVMSSCYFISDSIGFYLKNYGSLLRTSDAGDHWIVDTLSGVKEICFIDDSTGFVSFWPDSKFNGIFKTIFSGEEWKIFHAVETGFFEGYSSLSFIDEYNGWLTCENYDTEVKSKIIKYTEEHGWSEIPLGTSLPLNKISFINHDTGWITGGYSNDDGYYPLLMRSGDGGENWENIGIDYLINDFYFVNSDHGWAVGEDGKERGVILETFDSGRNWEVVIDLLSARLNALHFKDGYGWAVGENGLVLKSEYTSTSINRFMVFGDAHHYSPSPDFSQSMLYEMTLAAIEEEVDFVFITGDLGMQTFETPEEEDLVLKDWRFVLDTLSHHNIRVYACRGNVDAGSRETWDSLFSGIYAFPQNGPEMEKNLTYAIEYDNFLFLALDQYSDSHKINQEWLDSLLSTKPREHIFAAGHEPAFKLRNTNCMGVYPEERNLFWESLTDAGAKAYFSGHDHFYDHTILDDGDSKPENNVHHVTSGTGGGSIFSDSEYDGENGRWTPVRQFHEEEHGYVLVELDGDEVEMTWKHRIEPNVFEYGGDSYVFSTGTTSLKEIDQGNGDLMNYPNPFHSRTIINYQLSASGYVELNIYDLSGRIVANLVNEIQPAIEYEVEWKADGMEPGIYICELITGWNKEVIKMILID